MCFTCGTKRISSASRSSIAERLQGCPGSSVVWILFKGMELCFLHSRVDRLCLSIPSSANLGMQRQSPVAVRNELIHKSTIARSESGVLCLSWSLTGMCSVCLGQPRQGSSSWSVRASGPGDRARALPSYLVSAKNAEGTLVFPPLGPRVAARAVAL